MRASLGTVLLILVATAGSTASQPEEDPPQEEEDDGSGDESGGTGTSMSLDEGKMGKKSSGRGQGQYRMAQPVQLTAEQVVDGFTGLPARSADGTRLALPGRSHGDGALVCRDLWVEIVKVGETRGESISMTGGDPCLQGDDEWADALAASLPRLNEVLADGGFTSIVPAAKATEVDPALKVTASFKKGKLTVEAKLGKKKLGKAKQGSDPGEVLGMILVRAARPQLYLHVHTTFTSEANTHTARSWVVVPLKGGPAAWSVFETVAARLTRESPAGAEIAILPGADGLTAVSRDDTWRTRLASGVVTMAAVDHTGQAIWFAVQGKKATSLQVIDLLGAGTPEVVIDKLPAGHVWISYGTLPGVSLNDVMQDHRVDVALGARPKASHVDQQVCDMGDYQEPKPKSLKLKAVATLKAIAARAKEPPASTMKPAVDLVMINEFMGGDCGPFWPDVALRDRATGMYLDASDPSKRETTWTGQLSLFQGAWFAPSGKAWIAGGKVYRVDGGTIGLGDGLGGGGWLGGGRYVNPDEVIR